VPRATTVGGLRRRLSGDLDNIVARATEIDPSRRYATARDLSEDVRRHRAGRPVLARPSTPAYRFRKFVGRHRTGTAVVVAILLAAIALTVMLRRQAHQVEPERQRAEQASWRPGDWLAGPP
jgi:hypothetical protein